VLIIPKSCGDVLQQCGRKYSFLFGFNKCASQI
jgi:hypothetical protein